MPAERPAGACSLSTGHRGSRNDAASLPLAPRADRAARHNRNQKFSRTKSNHEPSAAPNKITALWRLSRRQRAATQIRHTDTAPEVTGTPLCASAVGTPNRGSSATPEPAQPASQSAAENARRRQVSRASNGLAMLSKSKLSALLNETARRPWLKNTQS